MSNKKVYLTNIFSFNCRTNNSEKRAECKETSENAFKLEVTVSRKLAETERAINFDNLKDVLQKNLVKKLDNQYLDKIVPVKTTCENLVNWMWNEIEPYVELMNCQLERVGLWENSTSKAEIIR